LKGLARELAAEFLGTFVLITFGVAVVAQTVLSDKTAGSPLAINFGWGLAVTMGAYVAGGVSGAHLNPAVTLALCVHRKHPWAKLLPYSLAQLAGAFVASALVYGTYFDALNAYDGGTRMIEGAKGTAGIWATYPQSFLKPYPGGLVDQVVGTALLMLGIFALTDRKNCAPTGNLTPLLVGALVFLIGMTFGFNSGYAINPARDLGPRLFTAIAGWGPGVFQAGHGWWWVPIVGPLIGAVLGGAVYDFFVGLHAPEESGKSNVES
jgi:MIP family channel proteins